MKKPGKYYRWPCLVFLLLSITSCTAILDDIELPEVDQKLVVNSLFNEGEQFKVSVSYSQTRGTSANLNVVADALVILSEDNSIVDTLVITEDPFYADSVNRWYYLSSIVPVMDRQYSVRISAEDYQPVYANDFLPEKAKIRFVGKESISTTGEEARKYLRIYLEIDQLNATGFYYIAVSEKRYINSIRKNYILFEMNDPILGQHSYNIEQDYLLFPGEFLANQAYAFSIDLNEEIVNSNSVYFELISLSYDVWKYLETVTAQKNLDTRISEPVKVYSNVEGGRGIFGGINVSVDSLLLSGK